MGRGMTGIAVVGAAALAACGVSREQFAPAEARSGESVQGYQEAAYDLVTTAGRFGEAKIRSEGAYRAETEVGERTVIHVGVTLENSGELPIRMPDGAATLESVQLDEQTLTDLDPDWVRGEEVVEPGSVGEREFIFALPAGVDPGDVDAFRVAWTATANGQRYSEFTPFVQTEPRYAYVPVYGYYHPYSWYDDPFFSRFWGVGYDVIVVDPYPRRVRVWGY